MLLRRITEHVKAQNWTAIALDFFIVIAGILIAFQITSWNEARANRAAADRYIASLAQDLRADIDDLEAVRQNKAVNAAIMEINLVGSAAADLEKLLAGPPVDRSSFPAFDSPAWPAFATKAFYGLTFDPSTQTFDMLVATGDVALIENYDLVQKLMAYRQAVVVTEDLEVNMAAYQVAMMPTVTAAGISFGYPIDSEKFHNAMESNEALKATMISVRTLMLASYARATQTQVLAQETLAALEAAQQ